MKILYSVIHFLHSLYKISLALHIYVSLSLCVITFFSYESKTTGRYEKKNLWKTQVLFNKVQEVKTSVFYSYT